MQVVLQTDTEKDVIVSDDSTLDDSYIEISVGNDTAQVSLAELMSAVITFDSMQSRRKYRECRCD